MSSLITEDELKKWTGFARRSDLESWLKSNKVEYTFGKGNKLMTTSHAVNCALIGKSAANDRQDAFF